MITRILKGQWPIAPNVLTAGQLREIVRELDDHGISGGVEIEAYGHDGEVKVLAGMRFQKDEGTPVIEATEAPPTEGEASQAHFLTPKPEQGGGGHTPGVGWMCAGCEWRLSYDVIESRARELWLSDSRHEVTK